MADADNLISLTPHALRGLAHPLRVRMLNELRERGPSTATLLAARLGESSGSTSYHLRQLASHGFVVEDTTRGDGRERWWRPAHRGTELNAANARAAPGNAEAYLRAVATADFQRVDEFLGALTSVPEAWQDVTTISSTGLRLTAAQAADLRARIEAVIAEFPVDDPEEPAAGGTDRVCLQWQLFPQLPDLPPRSMEAP
ncbi:winged helix-turn-helix domain-containing protein [Actinoplanes sp. NPDC051346]|uniref:winged helix-turn-helix domain-containing protein n=1 Tax=Actinoplanes sp. NPDC051346 TaxID=3155048 RepID=UPI0034151DA5